MVVRLVAGVIAQLAAVVLLENLVTVLVHFEVCQESENPGEEFLLCLTRCEHYLNANFRVKAIYLLDRKINQHSSVSIFFFFPLFCLQSNH